MTRASNYQIRSNGCNFVGIVNWLITTCVLSFGNYLLFDNSSAEGRGKHGCKAFLQLHRLVVISLLSHERLISCHPYKLWNTADISYLT